MCACASAYVAYVYAFVSDYALRLMCVDYASVYIVDAVGVVVDSDYDSVGASVFLIV